MCWPHRVGVSVCHVAFIAIFLVTGLPYGNPSRKVGGVCSVLFFFCWVASMANPVGICVPFRRFIIFIFFRVGKSLACHSPAK